MPTPTYCPTCGVPVAPGTQQCGNCGSSVHPTGSYPIITAAPEPPAARPRRGRRITLVAVAVGVAVVTAVLVVNRAGACETPAPDAPAAHAAPLGDPVSG